MKRAHFQSCSVDISNFTWNETETNKFHLKWKGDEQFILTPCARWSFKVMCHGWLWKLFSTRPPKLIISNHFDRKIAERWEEWQMLWKKGTLWPCNANKSNTLEHHSSVFNNDKRRKFRKKHNNAKTEKWRKTENRRAERRKVRKAEKTEKTEKTEKEKNRRAKTQPNHQKSRKKERQKNRKAEKQKSRNTEHRKIERQKGRRQKDTKAERKIRPWKLKKAESVGNCLFHGVKCRFGSQDQVQMCPQLNGNQSKCVGTNLNKCSVNIAIERVKTTSSNQKVPIKNSDNHVHHWLTELLNIKFDKKDAHKEEDADKLF